MTLLTRDEASALWAAVLVLAFATLPALLVCAWLRETPAFWRSDGGYAPLTRELVATVFYPLLTWTLAAGAWLTWRLASRPPTSVASLKRRVLGVVVLALLTGATLMLITANNIENVLDGRPLHWHAGAPQPTE